MSYFRKKSTREKSVVSAGAVCISMAISSRMRASAGLWCVPPLVTMPMNLYLLASAVSCESISCSFSMRSSLLCTLRAWNLYPYEKILTVQILAVLLSLLTRCSVAPQLRHSLHIPLVFRHFADRCYCFLFNFTLGWNCPYQRACTQPPYRNREQGTRNKGNRYYCLIGQPHTINTK